MIIKSADNNDKKTILEFCKNTFPWGDYIHLVWDHWMKEGNLLCSFENDIPIGICHGSVSKTASQLWIEGIRTSPEHRRKHVATKLLQKLESIGQQKLCTNSYMLIENHNVNSLDLAKSLNYKIIETWDFYSIHNNPQIQSTNAFVSKSVDDLFSIQSKSFRFVDSWRWFPFDNRFITQLLTKECIVSTFYDKIQSIATFVPSLHFENTLIVTILTGNQLGIKEIIKFIQNHAIDNSIFRLQLLIKSDIKFDDLSTTKRSTFHLLHKKI